MRSEWTGFVGGKWEEQVDVRDFILWHVQTLLSVFDALVDNGATVLVIEHDLDVIRNADYIIDMGPGGGDDGGRVIATGTPEEIVGNEDSVTGRYL